MSSARRRRRKPRAAFPRSRAVLPRSRQTTVRSLPPTFPRSRTTTTHLHAAFPRSSATVPRSHPVTARSAVSTWRRTQPSAAIGDAQDEYSVREKRSRQSRSGRPGRREPEEQQGDESATSGAPPSSRPQRPPHSNRPHPIGLGHARRRVHPLPVHTDPRAQCFTYPPSRTVQYFRRYLCSRFGSDYSSPYST